MAKTWALPVLILITSLAFGSYGQAQTDEPSTEQRIQELQERVAALEAETEKDNASADPALEEVTKLKLDLLVPEPLSKSFSGFSPAISQVYFSKLPFSVGGYGEVNYTSEQRGPRRTSLARINPYLGYRFSKALIFNSGFSFQNGGAVEGRGAARVEFAYLDFLLGSETSGIRVGHVLVPFGLLNLRPEPTQFPMVNRMSAERTIIPTTWHENGLLGFAKIGSVELQGGIVTSGEADQFERNTWIRAGRQFDGTTARAEDFSWVLRTEVVEKNSTLGLSLYSGKQSQNNDILGRSQVFLAALHGELTLDRFNAMAMYTEGALSDTDRIASQTGEQLGSRVRGGYLILSFDVLPKLAPLGRALVAEPPPPAWRQLPLFVSYEYQDLNAQPASGFSRTPGLRSDIWTFGMNFKPHPQVVIKADYALESDDAGRDARTVETSIGFVF